MKTFAALVLAATANAQQSGTQQSETHPSLTLQTCDSNGCTSATKKVVIDSNWRWTDKDGTNCYTGNEWDTTICTDADTCAEVCALEGADYESTYGIHASGSEIKLDFVTEGSYGNNVGSRSYMLNTDSTYEMFYLKNHEFTFDVDVSQLPCGLNGALYFVAMDEDGGLSANENNNAGAKYGTGYCDAQCPRDLKYIDGKANVENWEPSEKDVNSGTGDLGSCCFEMDIWEANKISQAVTPHTCNVTGQTMCTGDEECGDIDSGNRYSGLCDKDGCDFATYRLGDTTFYGEGDEFTLDTTSPLTVVTQFITDDNTDDGDLIEIRRKYVQNGNVIENPTIDIDGTSYDSITDDFCTDQKTFFGDDMGFINKGGLKAMGEQMKDGMVLVMSLWDDYAYNMWWLDSTYPTDADPSTPGVVRGTCSTDSGEPSVVEEESADAYVTYSNIKYGTINSTYESSSSPVVN